MKQINKGNIPQTIYRTHTPNHLPNTHPKPSTEHTPQTIYRTHTSQITVVSHVLIKEENADKVTPQSSTSNKGQYKIEEESLTQGYE